MQEQSMATGQVRRAPARRGDKRVFIARPEDRSENVSTIPVEPGVSIFHFELVTD
jgi:hypothetical protein